LDFHPFDGFDLNRETFYDAFTFYCRAKKKKSPKLSIGNEYNLCPKGGSCRDLNKTKQKKGKIE